MKIIELPAAHLIELPDVADAQKESWVVSAIHRVDKTAVMFTSGPLRGPKHRAVPFRTEAEAMQLAASVADVGHVTYANIRVHKLEVS